MHVSRQALLAAFLLSLFSVTGAFAQAQSTNRASSPPAEPVLEKNATDLVTNLATGRFEAVAVRLTDDLAHKITPTSMSGTWGRLSQRLGPFQKIITSKQDPGSSVVNVTCAFEHGEVNVEFVFDSSQRITGLWMQPAPGRHWPPSTPSPLSAATAPSSGIEGDWDSAGSGPRTMGPFHIHFKGDGTGMVDFSSIAASTPQPVQYRVEGNTILILGGLTFSGWLDGDHMVGKFGSGLANVCVITRRGADLSPGSLAGYWIGPLGLDPDSPIGMFELRDNGQGSMMFASDNIIPVRYSRNGDLVTMEFPFSYAGTTVRMKYSATITGTSLRGTLSSPVGNTNLGAITLTKIARPSPAPRMKSEWSQEYFSESTPDLITLPASPAPNSGGGPLSNPWAKPVNTDFAGFAFNIADQRGARVTQLVGINDSGVIAGYYISFFPDDRLHETATFPFIISHGQVTVLRGPVFDPRTFGLGGYRYVNTTPLAINNKGQVLFIQSSCVFGNDSCNDYYYLYNVDDATVRPLGRNFHAADHPNETFQAGYFVSLNDRGELLGRMGALQSSTMSFPFYGSPVLGPAGSTETPAAPGSFIRLPECSKDGSLVMLGINNRDQVVGMCPETATEPQAAVLYDGGKLLRFSYPGSTVTFATGISNSGLISGYYQAANAVKHQGFLFNGSQFFPVVPPGSTGGQIESSQAIAINSSGQVVGTYYDAAPPRQTHVYIASPRAPLPKH